MVRLILLLNLLTTALHCFAQQQKLDSLLNALKAHPQPDTVRLDIMNNINFTYQTIDPAKGAEKADEAIELAKRLGDKFRLALAFAYKGMNYSGESHFKGALEMFSQAAYLLEALGNNKKLASVYNAIGNVYLNTSNFSTAMDYYFKALEGYEKYNNKPGIAVASNNIGMVYTDLKKSSLALSYYTRAMKIYEESGDIKGLIDVFANMANTYENLRNVNKSLHLYLKALRISDSIGYTFGVASNNANIGISYLHQGSFSNADHYLRKAILMFHRMHDENNEALMLSEIAGLYVKAPDSVIVKKGLKLSGRYDIALSYASKALYLAEKVGAVGVQDDAWKLLSEIYEKKSSYNKALQAFKKYDLLKDSVLSDEKEQEITRREMQYTFNKKQDSIMVENGKQQAIAAAKLQQQRIINGSLVGGTCVLLLAGFTSFVFYKRRSDAESQRQKAEFQIEVAKTELKALRAQINPHFIFNSLDSIADFVDKNNSQTADYYLTQFSKMMRLTLENSGKNEVSLAKDLDALERYIQLEAMRLQNKFTYEIKVDEAIDKETTLIPPLIMQPFVENSIKHGITPKEGKGKIEIAFKREGEMIFCSVEDDGIGREEAEAIKRETESIARKSWGMDITRERIDILNKLKKASGVVKIFDLEKGTRVELQLPLELKF
ncbi:MAG: tetratricopeptide repeat protein [Williamsia sp.]|nr:tetratricopeptide repeat protein [Williamsia sp.]